MRFQKNMDSKEVKKVAKGRKLGKYLPSILFPSLCFGLIFMDWNHTRKWKLERALKANQLSDELNK